jgi:hypothetical protein
LIKWLDDDGGGTSCYEQMVKVSWLATLMDAHCSSFEEMELNAQGKGITIGFCFTGQKVLRG